MHWLHPSYSEDKLLSAQMHTHTWEWVDLFLPSAEIKQMLELSAQSLCGHSSRDRMEALWDITQCFKNLSQI